MANNKIQSGYEMSNSLSQNLSNSKFKTPVIGILTVPISKNKKKYNNIRSYLSDSYVKWIEMSGAQVVPICFNWSNKKITSVLNQINGVIFPGGSVDRDTNSDYMKYISSFKHIYQYAKKHKHFSLWATCLGFEFLVLMSYHSDKEIYNGYKNMLLIDNVDARHQTVPLKLTNSSAFNADIFDGFGVNDNKHFNNPCVYMNHGYGFSVSNSHISSYVKNIDILSTNTDKKGKEYVSTIEFKKYPFYGTQWHPEKVMFEFLDESIPHDDFSQYVSRKMSQMFVNRCRKNKNKLVNQKLLISYYTLYSRPEVLDIIDPKHAKDKKNSSIFEQSYYFE